MIKRMLKTIQRWRYLGYDRDTVQRYHAETDRANLRTIQRMCLLALTLTALLLVFFGPMLRHSSRIITAVAFAAFLVIFHLSIGRMLNTFPFGSIQHAKALVFLFSSVMYLCGIYSGTQFSSGELGVLSVWMFLLVQISFDIAPLQNLLTVIPYAVVFLLISKETKTTQRWQMDCIYTTLSVIVGLFVSYHQSRMALDNIIAKRNLQKTNFALYHTATTDELTGLMNRRMLFDRYDAILGDCASAQSSIACVVLDIDDYKQFNDSYGHPEGDALLRRIGAKLRNYSQETGIDIGRIGGEEFLAVWQEENIARCECVAEDLRCAIERMAIPHAGALDHEQVTVSVGLCLLPHTKTQGAYLYADKALYHAKDAGKNCSCRYDAQADRYLLLGGAGNPQ